MNLPEVTEIGDVELLFLDIGLANGTPRLVRRILTRRYGTDESGNAEY